MAGIVTAVAVLSPAAMSAAPDEAPPDFLRVEWHVVQRQEPIQFRIEGYVYNNSAMRVSDVRLHVVERDSGARPVGEAWGWVFGDVPGRGSGYFAIPLKAAADNYDVTVASFDPVGYEAP